MIRTFTLACALVAICGAVGYSQNLRGFGPANFKNPRTLAGQVNLDGSVGQGSHFSVAHLGTGEYEITFDERYFINGCPILTVTAINLAVFVRVSPVRCRVDYVYFYNTNGRSVDSEFNLVAVAAE